MLRPHPGSINVYIDLKKKKKKPWQWIDLHFQNLSTFFSRCLYKSTSNQLLLRLDEQHFVLGCVITQPAMEIEIWGNKAECQPNKGPSLAQREHWHTIESARGWKQGKGTGLPANRWAKREEWMWGDVSHKERNNTTWSWVLEMRRQNHIFFWCTGSRKQNWITAQTRKKTCVCVYECVLDVIKWLHTYQHVFLE